MLFNLMKNKFLKPLVLTLVVFVFLLSFINLFSFNVVYASDDKELPKDTTITNSFILKEYGEFNVNEGEPKYYHIDSVNEKDAKRALEGEEDFLEKIVGFFNVKENFKEMVNATVNWVVNLLFTFNRFMTTVMITVLEFAFNYVILDILIEKIDGKISGITGISNFKIQEGVGLFGNLMGIATMITVAYLLYIYLVKRAFIASASALVKTILATSIAILLFSNYSYYLTAVNGLSNEVAEKVMGAGAVNGLDESSLDSAKNTLWKLFVDRPYLYLQYGTTDYESLKGGKQRVMNLMKYPDGEDRYKYVLETEIAKYRNTLMVSNTADDKFAFSVLYLITNGILSILIFGLSFVLILLNFWFLIIAAIAPFALVIGIIPIFSGVFKRYFIELMIPLGLKVFFTFFTLFILMMSNFLYEISYQGSDSGIQVFVITVVLEIVLLAALFILRKRISDIFSSGSKIIAGLRESTKDNLQTTTALAGTAIGAATGGIVGANIGSAIGSATGKVLTGDLNSGDLVRVAKSVAINSVSKRGNTVGGETLSVTQDGESNGNNDTLQDNNHNIPQDNNDTNVPTETLHDEQTGLPNNNEETLNQNDTPTMHSLNDQETLNNDNAVQDSVNETPINNQPSSTLSNLDEDTQKANNNVPPTQTTPTNVPINTENTLQTPNNPVRYNPMEQDGKAQQYESLYDSPIQTTSVNTTASNGTPIDEVTPINTEPLNSPSTHHQSTASTQIQTSPMNSVPMNNQSINNQSLNSTPVNSQSIESQPIRNTAIQNQTIHENPINSQPIESKPMGSQPIHSQTVDERPINPTQATQRVNNTQQNSLTNRDNPSHNISEKARKLFEQFKNNNEE